MFDEVCRLWLSVSDFKFARDSFSLTDYGVLCWFVIYWSPVFFMGFLSVHKPGLIESCSIMCDLGLSSIVPQKNIEKRYLNPSTRTKNMTIESTAINAPYHSCRKSMVAWGPKWNPRPFAPSPPPLQGTPQLCLRLGNWAGVVGWQSSSWFWWWKHPGDGFTWFLCQFV